MTGLQLQLQLQHGSYERYIRVVVHKTHTHLLTFRGNTYLSTCVPCCIQSLAAYPFGFQWAVTNDGITIVGVVTAKAMRDARGGKKQPPKDTHT